MSFSIDIFQKFGSGAMRSFRKLATNVALLAAVGTLAACATSKRDITEVPVPTNFQSESMMKLQSVSHWNNVAVDMAAGVAKKYAAGNGCIPGIGCKTPIFVREPLPETKFSKAFHAQLVSALVNQGLPVMTQSKPLITTAVIDIQLVSLQPNQNKAEYDRKPNELVDGVWVIRDLADTAVQKFKALNAQQWSEGDANQNAWFKSPHFTPAVEMLVTVSFINDSQYVARTSNIYYLNSDRGYVPEVVASAAAPVPTTWSMSVVGDCTASRCVTK